MSSRLINSRGRLGLLAAACAAALSPAAAQADGGVAPPRAARPAVKARVAPAAAAPAAAEVVRVDLSSQQARQLYLPRGKSAVIELPADARDVIVSNPAVAEAAMRTPRRIFVMALAQGQTDAVFFDAMGRRMLSLDIRVEQDTAGLNGALARALPQARIRAEGAGDGVVLTGVVQSALDSDRALKLAQRYVDKPEKVINMLSVAGQDQVMLKVRVIEVQRTVIKQLGFNLSAVLNQLGEPQYLLGSAASFGVNGSFLGSGSGGYKLDTTKQPVVPALRPDGTDSGLVIPSRTNPIADIKSGAAGSAGLNQGEATIRAFERVGLVRTLAEPTLTSVNGEGAKFLAGGEFPVPTGQDNTGRTTIEFKPFGVGLGFTPVVLSGGRISMKISTEVSELSNVGAFSLSNGAGAPALVVPALSVRRAESVVELPSGGALMMAGLLQSRSKQAFDKIPGLADLPVIGALVRSRDFLNDETELVVIVTPYIVQPGAPQDFQTPADGLQLANDAQAVLMGKLNKAYNAPAPVAPGAYQGPHGYVID